jgi:hyperosmotically inducible periplasmic protein
MTILLRIATAFAAGAVAMYFMDPLVGRRRRALMRDQGVAAGHNVEDFVRVKSRRAVHRLNGTVARTRARLSQGPVDDEQLLERIRSRLGHVLEHPRSVEVAVRDGNVVLTGRASATDIDHLMEAISGMRGVEDVENRLWVVRATAGGSQAEQEMRH